MPVFVRGYRRGASFVKSYNRVGSVLKKSSERINKLRATGSLAGYETQLRRHSKIKAIHQSMNERLGRVENRAFKQMQKARKQSLHRYLQVSKRRTNLNKIFHR
jgi:hypothetical protein